MSTERTTPSDLVMARKFSPRDSPYHLNTVVYGFIIRLVCVKYSQHIGAELLLPKNAVKLLMFMFVSAIVFEKNGSLSICIYARNFHNTTN